MQLYHGKGPNDLEQELQSLIIAASVSLLHNYGRSGSGYDINYLLDISFDPTVKRIHVHLLENRRRSCSTRRSL